MKITLLQFGKIFAGARSNLEYEDFYCRCPLVPFDSGLLAAGVNHAISFSPGVAVAVAFPDCGINDRLDLQIYQCCAAFPVPDGGFQITKSPNLGLTRYC